MGKVNTAKILRVWIDIENYSKPRKVCEALCHCGQVFKAYEYDVRIGRRYLCGNHKRYEGRHRHAKRKHV